MIAYSPRAVIGLTRLFDRYNDLNVYVEDVTCVNVYKIYLSRILADRAKLRTVFPLGGRKNVIDACKTANPAAGKPELYIVDADFDLLLGRKKTSLKNLCRLNAYCFENLLVCSKAGTAIAFETVNDKSEEQIFHELDFVQWRDKAVELLLPLFIVYAICQRLKLPIATSSRHIYSFYESINGLQQLSVNKIQQRIVEIETEIFRTVTKSKYRQLKKKIQTRAKSIPDSSRMKFISGKTYLLPHYFKWLQSLGFCTDREASIKGRLARHVDLRAAPHLTKAVFRAIEPKT